MLKSIDFKKKVASLLAEKQAAPPSGNATCAKSPNKFEIEIGFNFSLAKFFELAYYGGFMLQNGELFPPNFEYLGKAEAQEFFKDFGVLYDTHRKTAIFFLGDGQYCELTQEQMFNPANAEYVKYFVGRIPKLREKNYAAPSKSKNGDRTPDANFG